MGKCWYAVQVLSGFERQVARSLVERIRLRGMGDLFGEVMVPAEEVIEVRRGLPRRSERRFFPGYVLVQMTLTDDSCHLVREIPRVTGFVGSRSGGQPPAIPEGEIGVIVERLQRFGDKPRPKILFETGELVRINYGPFSDFNGRVEELDYEKNRLKVSVSIFGRDIPVELGFDQVEKG